MLHSLSLLAKRMAKVCFSGSPSDTSAVVFHTQLRSLPTLGLNFISGTTVTGRKMVSVILKRNHKPELKKALTVVVGADLEGLVTSHDEASLAVLLMLQQPDVASPALFPLLGVADEFEQLGAHLEELLLRLLVGLGVDLLRQFDDGLEVDVFRLGRLFL